MATCLLSSIPVVVSLVLGNMWLAISSPISPTSTYTAISCCILAHIPPRPLWQVGVGDSLTPRQHHIPATLAHPSYPAARLPNAAYHAVSCRSMASLPNELSSTRYQPYGRHIPRAHEISVTTPRGPRVSPADIGE